jgi:hypothetical protein
VLFSEILVASYNNTRRHKPEVCNRHLPSRKDLEAQLFKAFLSVVLRSEILHKYVFKLLSKVDIKMNERICILLLVILVL